MRMKNNLEMLYDQFLQNIKMKNVCKNLIFSYISSNHKKKRIMERFFVAYDKQQPHRFIDLLFATSKNFPIAASLVLI